MDVSESILIVEYDVLGLRAMGIPLCGSCRSRIPLGGRDIEPYPTPHNSNMNNSYNYVKHGNQHIY